ncbi:MAG: DUF3822 family protein [Saprospiraceae bacterium]|nr:DUF3822 family protein [Saprospiraceae bacterium]
MSNPTNPPELIISLSRDKVGVHLLAKPQFGRVGWKSSFPVVGGFMEDQISNALDTALNLNPSLVDQFHDVAVVVVDRPNVCVPRFYAEGGKLSEIVSRYLRVRYGDALSSDITSGEIVIAYSLPAGTIKLIREYYSNSDQIHLTSLLWNAICQLAAPTDDLNSRLFYFITGNSLIIIGETGGKLTFSKSLYIQDHGDVAYYAIACARMLMPKENWLLTIEGEEVSFDMPGETYFRLHHRLELPDLHTLVATHRSCGS